MKIEFIPTQPEDTLLKPVPAVTRLPEWYKNLSPFMNGDRRQEFYPNGEKNITLKWCNPFGDALGAGYFILLENEIQIRQHKGGASLNWNRGGEKFISNHHNDQFSKELVPNGYENRGLKFTNLWGIKTPAGYSTLFTHPLSSYNQPFLILSGVVDTDRFHAPVNFPFFVREGYEGNVSAGTPIAQVIPFRRENWESEVASPSTSFIDKIFSDVSRHITRPYKRLFWSRKEYK